MKLTRILLMLAIGFSSYAWGHSDHVGNASADPLVALSPEATTEVSAVANATDKPAYLGSASLKLLESPIPLSSGYGEAYFITQPQNEEEQFLNLGFSALNVFHYADAFRAFRTAYLKNSDSVFAQVGIIFASMELDPSPAGAYFVNVASEQITKIQNQRSLTAKETAWADFAKALSGSRMGLSLTAIPLGQAYQNLIDADGSNPEALGYVNWSILSGANLEYIKTGLNQVLQTYPTHAGANHYLLHIAEMQNQMDLALDYAEVLIVSSPDSAHAQHMYGHILPQSGQWQKALDQFLIADGIHKQWALDNQVPLEEDWHYAHNLDLMAAAYLGLGQTQTAMQVWAQAMGFDYRAIPKAIGLAMVLGDFSSAEQMLTTFEAQGPQWVNFLKPLRDELALLKTAGTSGYASNASMGTYAYLVRLVVALKDNPSFEAQVVSSINQFFTSRLTAGGFDGWSNGFVELLRLKAVAEALNTQSVVDAINDLETKARQGQL